MHGWSKLIAWFTHQMCDIRNVWQGSDCWFGFGDAEAQPQRVDGAAEGDIGQESAACGAKRCSSWSRGLACTAPWLGRGEKQWWQLGPGTGPLQPKLGHCSVPQTLPAADTGGRTKWSQWSCLDLKLCPVLPWLGDECSGAGLYLQAPNPGVIWDLGQLPKCKS